ncbi:MAG: adenine-specific methyltransferase EcoRI family protein [Planctomycetaceae bacterium]|jgi:hypothetical protein|nr:adenine-specific methyltransferase EcoRI family protein [Planctomycetaceae bacterium]
MKRTTRSLEERGFSPKDIMQKAQRVKNDEFYTRYEDVEKEILMYDKSIWNNKIVFCNCGDAVDDDEKHTSAFALYFLRHFTELGLKKLICTCGGMDLLNQGAQAYIFMKDRFHERKDFPKHYTGSFDDPLSLKILREEADIVCTNPPFSRAKDYWKRIIESGKRFLIISNITNAINTGYIPYFKDKKVWAGYHETDWFLSPKRELMRAAGYWFTNIPIKNRAKYKQLKIVPLKAIPVQYKKYDDSRTLLAEKGYIPCDYKKPFAVSARRILNGLLEKGYKIVQDKQYIPYVDGKKHFARVLVQEEQ